MINPTNLKLELKHLAPYLPHRLELIFLKSGRRITMLSCFFDSDTLHVVDKNEGNEYPLTIWDFKPIMRPLSDLTKGIEIYNTITVPIDYISTSKANSQKIMRRVAHNLPLDNLEYWQVERLFELHFDVFGLIESGLAVKK